MNPLLSFGIGILVGIVIGVAGWFFIAMVLDDSQPGG